MNKLKFNLLCDYEPLPSNRTKNSKLNQIKNSSAFTPKFQDNSIDLNSDSLNKKRILVNNVLIKNQLK